MLESLRRRHSVAASGGAGYHRAVMAKFAVILPAAGKSSRFSVQKRKKPFVELRGRAVWLRAAEHFVNRDDVAPTSHVVEVSNPARTLALLPFKPCPVRTLEPLSDVWPNEAFVDCKTISPLSWGIPEVAARFG